MATEIHRRANFSPSTQSRLLDNPVRADTTPPAESNPEAGSTGSEALFTDRFGGGEQVLMAQPLLTPSVGTRNQGVLKTPGAANNIVPYRGGANGSPKTTPNPTNGQTFRGNSHYESPGSGSVRPFGGRGQQIDAGAPTGGAQVGFPPLPPTAMTTGLVQDALGSLHRQQILDRLDGLVATGRTDVYVPQFGRTLSIQYHRQSGELSLSDPDTPQAGKHKWVSLDNLLGMLHVRRNELPSLSDGGAPRPQGRAPRVQASATNNSQPVQQPSSEPFRRSDPTQSRSGVYQPPVDPEFQALQRKVAQQLESREAQNQAYKIADSLGSQNNRPSVYAPGDGANATNDALQSNKSGLHALRFEIPVKVDGKTLKVPAVFTSSDPKEALRTLDQLSQKGWADPKLLRAGGRTRKGLEQAVQGQQKKQAENQSIQRKVAQQLESGEARNQAYKIADSLGSQNNRPSVYAPGDGANATNDALQSNKSGLHALRFEIPVKVDGKTLKVPAVFTSSDPKEALRTLDQLSQKGWTDPELLRAGGRTRKGLEQAVQGQQKEQAENQSIQRQNDALVSAYELSDKFSAQGFSRPQVFRMNEKEAAVNMARTFNQGGGYTAVLMLKTPQGEVPALYSARNPAELERLTKDPVLGNSVRLEPELSARGGLRLPSTNAQAVQPQGLNEGSPGEQVRRKLEEQLEPGELERFRRYVEANPDIGTLFNEAAHGEPDKAVAAAARELSKGGEGKGSEVIARLRNGSFNYDGGGKPPTNSSTAAASAGEPDDAARRAALFAEPQLKALLDKEPSLRESLQKNPELVDLMASRPVLTNVLVACPDVLKSVLKHPESVQHIKNTFEAIDQRGADAVAADKQKPVATPLTAEQLALSERIRAAMPEEKPTQPGFDPARKEDPAYQEAYLDKLYADATVAKAELKGMTEKIAAATGGTAAFRPGDKERQRSGEKIQSDYGGDASQLVDLASSKIVYDNLEDLYKGLAAAEKEFGAQIVRVKDRFIKPVPSGYRDILMNVKMSNGHVAEFRLHLKQVDEQADTEHALYRVGRSLEPVAQEQKRPLTQEEAALKTGLNRESQKLYEKALEEAMRDSR